MLIHELLEACVEYIALDGVLGCHPSTLQAHLVKSDPSIDDYYFAYLYTLLISHPSIRVIITTYPLPTLDGKYILGNNPLPADFNPPDTAINATDLDALYREGLRGRQLAYHLAGQEYISSKQAIEEKRVQQEKARKEKLKQAKNKARNVLETTTPYETIEGDLYRCIEVDDGNGLAKSDLTGLMASWGTRLRLRCTDEEIYFRLTGSHQKIPKITSVVFHILQLAARSRERGITAIELGPMVGASQGSMHYYMKVLIALGLCAKVPAVIHGSITNLLLFHSFLDQNENYRALKRMAPLPLRGSIKGKERADQNMDEDEIADDGAVLEFSSITEHELMAGHVVKERLIKLLDHPSLKNHLLKVKHLLPYIGWQGEAHLRHRRALTRHISSLVLEGTVERLMVGQSGVRVIRLMKYNPDYKSDVPPAGSSCQAIQAEVVPRSMHGDLGVPFNPLGGVSMAMSVEHIIIKAIIDSGTLGISIAEIRDQVCGLYKRMIDFLVSRLDDLTLPLHLHLYATCAAMESVGKERRIRLFGVSAYRVLMQSQGVAVNDHTHPPTPPKAGRFADISYRPFFATQEDINRFIDSYVPFELEPIVPRSIGRPPGPGKGTKSGKAEASARKEGSHNREDIRVTRTGREYLYSNDVQTRGRPRKYIYVVDENGKPNRRVLGHVLPYPKLAPVWIYFSEEDKLVEAPPGYSGVGQVPQLTRAQINAGKPPSWFDKFPRHKDKKELEKGKKGKVKKGRPKGKRKRGVGAEGDTEDGETGRTKKKADYREEVDELDEEGSEKEEGGMPVEGAEPDLHEPEPSRAAENRAGEPDEGTAVHPPTVDGESDPAAAALPVSQAASRGRGRRKTVKPTAAAEAPIIATAAGGVVTDSILPDIGQRTEKEPIAPVVAKKGAKRKATAPIITPGTEAPSSALEEASKPSKRSRAGKAKAAFAAEHVPPAATQSNRPRSPSSLSNIALPADPLFNISRVASPPTSPFVLPAEFSKVKKGKGNSKGMVEAKQEPKDRHTGEIAAQDPRLAAFASVVSDLASLPDEALGVAEPSGPQSEVLSRRGTPLNEAEATTPVLKPTAATPLREVMAARPAHTPGVVRARDGSVLSIPSPRKSVQLSAKTGRVDLSVIRKTTEICQTLLELGGVMAENKLLAEHRDWTARVAGTDAPSAPTLAYGMDRHVFKRTITMLQNDGRIKMTKAQIPTPTGRWIQVEVVYLSNLPWDDVQTYIRALASSTSFTLQGKRTDPTRIPEANFTEVRAPNVSKTTVKVDKAPAAEMTKREALLKEKNVASYLYGWKSGRWVRMQVLHRAIIQAMARASGRTSLISSLPKVFAIPLLFEELTIGDWFECVMTMFYDPELEQWLNGPVKRQTRLRELPMRMRPPGGFSCAAARAKLTGLLVALCELKVISPLKMVEPEKATIRTNSETLGVEASFAITDLTSASYFLVHDFAPVYHLASDTPGLLGILPVRSDAELQVYWKVVKEASIQPDLNRLPRLECRAPTMLPTTAPVTEVLEPPIEFLKMIRSYKRWWHEIRLLPAQRAALDGAINWDTAERLVLAPEDVEELAYENALPRDFVEAQLRARVEHARRRSQRPERREAASQASYRAKLARAREQLRQKLEERRLEAKAAWEKRVKEAANKVGMEFSPELADFVRRQTLQASNRVELNDEAIEGSVRLFRRSKEIGESVPAGRLPRLPAAPRVKRQKHVAVVRRESVPKGARRRKHWSHEDDELLLDAEAIILARANGRRNPGRAAAAQLFPELSNTSFLHRIKKILTYPGKQAYLEKLVAAWTEVWMEHRGTEALPDDKPESLTEFDLKRHVEFLREKINKTNLRLAAMVNPNVDPSFRVIDLPETVEALLEKSVVQPKQAATQTFQAVHDPALSEDQKIGSLALISLLDEKPLVSEFITSRSRGLLSACLKMVVATPQEVYDQQTASILLEGWEESERGKEIARLANDKVFVEQRGGAQTGRFYAFSQAYMQLCDGPYPPDLFGEAESMEKRLDDPEGLEWPILGKPGDIASLLNLVSNHEVDFEFDVDEFPTLRGPRDSYSYNTRKLNDDSFEFRLHVTRKRSAGRAEIRAPDPLVRSAPVRWPQVPRMQGVESVVPRVLELIEATGPEGFTKEELRTSTGCTRDALDTALAALSNEQTQRVFWAGYDTARIISISHSRAWMALTRPYVLSPHGALDRQAGRVMCIPRRWMTIYGGVMEQEWRRARTCAAGHILGRPGIMERALRAKLVSAFDRLETNDVLQNLLDSGVVRRDWVVNSGKMLPPVEATAVEEEDEIAWWPVPGAVLA